MFNNKKSWLLLCLIIGILFSFPSLASAHSPDVRPPDIDPALNPHDENAERVKIILLNTNKYALTTWWAEKSFPVDHSGYINFGGTTEHFIRHPAAMSLGLATSIAFDLYDSEITGVPLEEAKDKTIMLISSLAYRHKANTRGGWGDHWQSAHWAYFAGFAGWLLWDEFPEKDQEFIRKMVEYEADRFTNYIVPYWKNTEGIEIYKGDTKAEENAWNAQILQLATAMMPEHKNWLAWIRKNIELMISSAARPSDLNNNGTYHGRPVKVWIDGWNINEDGTVINHGFIHPDYMEFIVFNNTAALTATLANQPTPQAAFFNSAIVYKSFTGLDFPSPPYDAPGGTIYIKDSPDIYYPQGNDWGTGRRMNFATMDAFAAAFGYDKLAGTDGSYWEALHAQKVLDMQNRHPDGRTYQTTDEDQYRGREEWVAHHAAWTWIAKWVANSGRFQITDENYGLMNHRLAGPSRFHTAVEISKYGWKRADTVILARSDTFPDALAGVPLAVQENAPILLTDPNQLNDSTLKEMKRIGAKHVILLGGPEAISERIKNEIKSLSQKNQLNVTNITRINGNNRFETAAKIAEKLNGAPEKAIIVYGYNFPDALAASYYAAKNGYPILLTDTEAIPYHTKKALQKIKSTIIVGGHQVVGPSVERQLPDPKRIDGNHRYETAVKLFEEFKENPKKIVLVNGESFSDALTGSVLAAKNNAPILLIEKHDLPRVTEKIFKRHSLREFEVIGGEAVISEELVQQLSFEY